MEGDSEGDYKVHIGKMKRKKKELFQLEKWGVKRCEKEETILRNI